MEPSSSPSPARGPSPGMAPVHLWGCIEELVRLTLSSSLDGTLGGAGGLRLSSDYCARLLQDEAPLDDPRLAPYLNTQEGVSDACGGVPVYPLYKRLALALERCVNHGSFLRTSTSMKGIPEVESWNRKEEWSELIAEMGSELLSMYKAAQFELHVQEPFFSQLRVGLKTVEGRCALGNYNRIGPGDLLLFNKCLLLQVEHVKRYPSFLDMLEAETLMNVLPGIKAVEEGVQVYRSFYTEERERSNGVLAISVSRPDSQPYISMSALLSGLGYEGVGCLLGMVYTIGTTPEVLPPPRSVLLSSFILPHRPDVSSKTSK